MAFIRFCPYISTHPSLKSGTPTQTKLLFLNQQEKGYHFAKFRLLSLKMRLRKKSEKGLLL